MTDRDTVLTVIRYLGRIALILAVGFLALTANLLYLAGQKGAVDPVAVGAVGAVGSALTFVLGALGAMLVSTKTGPSEGDLEALAAAINGPRPPAPEPLEHPAAA